METSKPKESGDKSTSTSEKPLSVDEPRHPLDAIFRPRSVAVIGASDEPDNFGHMVLSNLVEGPLGPNVFPVNPNHRTVLDRTAHPTIDDVPVRVDLAVIVTKAATVPGIVAECVDAGVRGAIIISAGFKECGPSGAELEKQILIEARRGNMRIIGPNCLGVMTPPTGLNASIARSMARSGNVAFLSQSGALCLAILDWSLHDMIGFSAFVSVGSMLDVNWGDLISYFGKDFRTKSIVIYMETIGDARSFLSAAREVAISKPIIVLKAGRTAAAASAAASHTGALTGSDDVLDAAFQRSGVLRVESISHLFYMAEVLAKQPRPRGPRLTILTNAGGLGVLATDMLLSSGGQLAELSPETYEALNKILPRHWSHNNPIDVIGDTDEDCYLEALEFAAKDPNSDGLLSILIPQSMTNPAQIAGALKKERPAKNKPLLASWMGGAEIDVSNAILNHANIPTFDHPDAAAKVFSYMWEYNQNLRSLYETPVLPAEFHDLAPDRTRVSQIIAAARHSGRTLLTEIESKQLLDAYRLPTVETHLATSEDEAVKWADQIGYPIVLKIHSETITHKSDVGGVRLNLADASAVSLAYRAIESKVSAEAHHQGFLGVTVQPMIHHEGYELILGSSFDLQFGPVLLFGLGGQLVEVFKDRALGLPPLTSTLARRMMEQTRIYKALQGVRGREPVDLTSLEQLMVRFSHLVDEQRWIKEIDINPLLASPERLIVLDARVVLHPPQIKEEDLPKLAIRPYPHEYVTEWQLKDGTPVVIRPIRAEDEPLMSKFHETLSDESVYSRFFRYMPLSRRVAHDRLSRICFVDYDQEIGLVVEYKNPTTHEYEILGIGRLIKLWGTNDAEFAVLVSDRWQGHGLGYKLLAQLVEIGRQEKHSRIIGTILPENHSMQHIAQKLGFKIGRSIEDQTVEAIIEL